MGPTRRLPAGGCEGRGRGAGVASPTRPSFLGHTSELLEYKYFEDQIETIKPMQNRITVNNYE
jgi:hypothetical protein